MSEVKVKDLAASALNWAVARALGAAGQETGSTDLRDSKHWVIPSFAPMRWDDWTPATDWAQAGPLIQKFGVMLSPPASMMHVNGGPNAGWRETGNWSSTIFGRDRKHRRACFDHPTEPLVAAMQTIVQFEFGDCIEVPADLLP